MRNTPAIRNQYGEMNTGIPKGRAIRMPGPGSRIPPPPGALPATRRCYVLDARPLRPPLSRYMPTRAGARPGGSPGGHACGGRGLAGFGVGLVRAVAVPLRLVLACIAVVIGLVRAGLGLVGRFARAGGGFAGRLGGDLGFDVGQRVVGMLGEPGQVAGRERDAVTGP